jgi:hypothetical protein
MQIVGTRGFAGKKALNSRTQADQHIEIEGSVSVDRVKKERAEPDLNTSLFEI